MEIWDRNLQWFNLPSSLEGTPPTKWVLLLVVLKIRLWGQQSRSVFSDQIRVTAVMIQTEMTGTSPQGDSPHVELVTLREITACEGCWPTAEPQAPSAGDFRLQSCFLNIRVNWATCYWDFQRLRHQMRTVGSVCRRVEHCWQLQERQPESLRLYAVDKCQLSSSAAVMECSLTDENWLWHLYTTTPGWKYRSL